MAFAVSTASWSPSRPLKVPATPTTATSPSKPLKVPSTSTTSLSRLLKVPTTFTTSPDNDDANHGSYNKGPQYRIFYDKKLSPQAKELLCQDRLHEQSSVAWWEGTKHSSDFWLTGKSAWFRIHVTPRKALCNPSTWKTNSTVQRDRLLNTIGDFRITEGFCCKSGKPLEIAVDRWRNGESEPSFHPFPMLWIGRSTFAKRGFRIPSSPAPRALGDVFRMQAAGDQQHVEDTTAGGVQSCGPCGPPHLDGGRAEGGDPGVSHGECVESAEPPDEVDHQLNLNMPR